MTDIQRRRLFGASAIVVVLGALTWLSYGSLGDNLVYYWSPTELVQRGAAAEGVTVRLGGLVVPGTFDLSACSPGCNFKISDGRTEVAVATAGMPPQMFREGIGVVVEGALEGQTFRTERVMIKHSNEYKAPTDGSMPKDMASTLVNE
jgi:cytochrome c-type biogenesis protein CcmE